MNEEEKKQGDFPSVFQRRMLWIAITAIALVVISVIAVGAVWLGGKVLAYLQPILVPIVIAGITAYLLEPVITWLRIKTRWSHRLTMMVVFSAFMIFVVLLVVAVVVPGFGQAREFVSDWNKYQVRATDMFQKTSSDIQERFNSPIAREYYDKGIEWLSEEGPKVVQKIAVWTWDKLMGAFGFFGYLLGLILVPIYLFFFLRESHSIKETWSDYLPLRASSFKDEVVDTLQEINRYLVAFFRGQMVVSLIDGALVAVALSAILQLPYSLLIGVFLAILGLIPYIGNVLVMIPAVLIAIVHFGDKVVIDYPLDHEIQSRQVRYVEIEGKEKRKFVSEVKPITEVNVSWEGREVTGYVPYTKDVSQPAVGDVVDVTLPNGIVEKREILEVLDSKKRAWVMKNAWSYLPNMWFYPLFVLGIFIVIQQINGLVTAPMIVGDSVGLHPLTVIFSVLFWSFLLGGLLGALLAIPLTASLKVLFRRYVWVQRIEPRMGPLGEKNQKN